MANPRFLRWTHDHRNTDASLFGPDQFAGFELEINEAPAASVPVTYDLDGQYEMPLADLSAVQQTGQYTLRIRVVNRAGNASAFSQPVSFAMDFRVPTAPSGLSVG